MSPTILGIQILSPYLVWGLGGVALLEAWCFDSKRPRLFLVYSFSFVPMFEDVSPQLPATMPAAYCHDSTAIPLESQAKVTLP